MGNKLEDIEVYTLALNFANEIWDLVSKWDYYTKDTIGKQLVRAADSISANIAEGFGRFHYKDNKNFCYYSRGSIMETKDWLKKAQIRTLSTFDEYHQLLTQPQTIHLKLNAYIKQIGLKAMTVTNDY